MTLAFILSALANLFLLVLVLAQRSDIRAAEDRYDRDLTEAMMVGEGLATDLEETIRDRDNWRASAQHFRDAYVKLCDERNVPANPAFGTVPELGHPIPVTDGPVVTDSGVVDYKPPIPCPVCGAEDNLRCCEFGRDQ